MLEFRGVHQEILDDETEELDVEGARMSAKTWTISEKIRRSCLKHPGIWWLACRFSGTETENQLRPQLVLVCHKQGTELEWHDDESAYWLPERDGKISKIFAFGLKSQSRDQRFAKIRGSGFAGVWVDQAEELPEDIGTEIRALVRQPGFPHQLIFSPNPPNEEHFLADQFPDGVELPGRKYYRLSLYDNRHNLDKGTIEKMEMAYPPTHAKHKSLILGERGPNVTGTPVYQGAFERSLHVRDVLFDPTKALLEAFDAGKHHPSWLAAQRTHFGGLQILGGIIGKRLFLDDFLPMVQEKRFEWFGTPQVVHSCCDAPMDSDTGARITTNHILRNAGIKLRWRDNSNAPDVREAIMQNLGSMMLRRAGGGQAFVVNSDPTRWLMASHSIVKQTKLFVDALEGSYVWDAQYVSVGNKTVRKPRFDEWLDGQQRCLENIMLNFCAGQKSEAEKERDRNRLEAASERMGFRLLTGPTSWMQ